MKQYVFTFETNNSQRDLIFTASGIVDAVNQVKLITNVIKTENKYQTQHVKYKGVIYNSTLL